MFKLFEYNWQVRNDWFAWCEKLPEEELHKTRVGGVGSIYLTLLHIIEVEKNWIHDVNREPIPEFKQENFKTLAQLIELSESIKPATLAVLEAYNSERDYEIVSCPESDGTHSIYTFGEILRHLIAHEIHHIGQISVWAREIGETPVTANLIRRGLFK
ncbi:DinB family protein [Alkalihalobacillus pseudalcaliphilus]|uniref:DinB family protein n=1 Tax=Alkalihalobacillus pseudalcaliphilus TaxID=79884 RepID=UPI00064D88F7|nr:DinB family protein [Alkalihalobacillus pseudalcaliphilus]KMK74964.1 hypothetical protein AB990_15925 [Alkalihalobacillus pseudalcaliphilus]